MEDVMKHEFEPYFEEDEKANDWVNEILGRVRWNLFRSQEEWLYMAGELGKRRNPMTRYNAYDHIYNTINREMYTLIDYLVMELLREYHEDGIDFDLETADAYNESFGLSEDDEGYVNNMGWDTDSPLVH